MINNEYSFDGIMDRMLSNIDDSFDKRETSLIYQSTAMIVPELLSLNSEIDMMNEEIFPDTCSYNNLVSFCRDRKIYPKEATQGYVIGEFNRDIEIGARFNCDTRNFRVIESLDEEKEETEQKEIYKYHLIAEETGHIEIIGDMTPIEDIGGLKFARIVEIVKDGREQETLEDLRFRYIESLNYQAFGGNRADYRDKILEFDNIGGVRTFRRTVDGENVEIVVLDNTFKKADDDMVLAIQEAIDPTQDGEGVGLAPIGHKVKVYPVGKETVNISTKLDIKDGVDLLEDVKESIEEYLQELRMEWGDNEESLVVRISKIENKLLSLNGIIDVSSTTINGLERNYTVNKRSIPILGDVKYDNYK
ncbi:baseplate J/gp47 family protein [Peptostreptococcus faecalis]|uniref:baseplate J/gp47 family protein n=1 Tax=Peptostreptococcus faecalis TaxID=2045015 RepID=UPI000C7A8F66|nr:baseplate J/gp47 family protein [Peptostreptococcus faecalis]